MNIIEFIRDPELINGELSLYQETALRLFYGLPLNKEQVEIAKSALDVQELLADREFEEGTFICGRRSGKSDRIAANIAVYEAVQGGHEHALAPGERAHILLVAQDMRACRVLFRFILGKLKSSDILNEFVDAVRSDEIELTNGITISIFPCSFRATRGFAIPVAIFDEIAFYRVDGVNVDRDVINSVRPAQAQFPRPKLVKISSPYAKQGELYQDYATRHSRPDFLCFHAPSWRMNPSLRQTFLDSERARDPDHFDREYAAIFTDQLANAFSREAVESCVIPGRRELAPSRSHTYDAGVDPSGGGADEFTVSVCHEHRGKLIQDCLRAYKTNRPADVVKEIASMLKNYGVQSVHGDKYSGEWVRQEFRKYSVDYVVSDITASESFLELLPLVNQGNIELLDDKVQTAQLVALERRRGHSGRDQLGHPQGGHDDRANCLALATYYAQVNAKVASEMGGIF
jgi:hypothetical protein